MKRKIKVQFLFLLLFSFSIGATACAPKPLTKVEYADDKSIVIGGWVAPPPANAMDGNADFINNATYKEIADSGINMIYGLYEGADANGLRALDAAEANHIKYLMYDRSLLGIQEEDFDMVPSLFALYKDHPAFAGNLVSDEPGGSKFDRLGALHDIYKQALPDKLFYVNLFPTYSSVSQRDDLTYKEYINAYIEKVKPEFISFDYYPLMSHAVEGNYFKEDYLSNLEIVSNAAKKAGIPFWTFIQAMGYTTAGMTNREVNEADIRWQAYTNLAFGAQALQYFCYWTPMGDGLAQFGNAMIDQKGNKTPTYDAVKNVNTEILAFDHIFLNFSNVGVMRFANGEMPNVMYMEDSLQSFEPIKSVTSEQPVIIGCFEDKDGNKALMIVNYTDPSDGISNKVTISLDKIRGVLSYAGGVANEQYLTKGTFETTLEPGEGQFILLLK